MPATNFTPIQLYRSTTASQVPTSGNLSDGELAINTNDEKLYFKNSGGTVKLLASSAGASGDVVGPASATDNAVVRFDGTTGKLVQNSVVTIADSTGDVAGVGALTMGGTLTLSGGTANGVLYLNGSKVATSGSALTFDGTKLLASAGASATGEFKTTSSTAQVFSLVASNDAGTSIGLGVFGSAAGTFGTLTAGNPFLSTAADRMVQNVQNASGAFIWGIGSTPAEQMRLNTTGLGLGTNTPQTKVHLVGTTELRLNTTASGAVIQFWKDAAATAASSIGNAIPGGSVTDDLLFATYTGSAWVERMRLTSTGLGIGTSSPAAPLSFGSTTGQKIRFYNTLSGYGIGVESSEFRFVTDNSAVFTWGIGTYASPSEQMRLTSTGLAIGTPTASAEGRLTIGSSTVTDKNGIVFNRGTAASVSATQAAIFNYNNGIGTSEGLFFRAPGGFAWQNNDGSTEWMRLIGSSGNLLIGTATSLARLTVSGDAIFGQLSPATRYTAIGVTGIPTIRYDDNGIGQIILQNRAITGTDQGFRISAQFSGDGTNAYSGGYIQFLTESTYTGTASTQDSALTFATVTDGEQVEKVRITSGGRVGVNTQTPGSILEVVGASAVDTTGATGAWTLRLRDTTSTAVAGTGSSLLFQGIKATAGSVGNYAAIAGLKENSTNGNEDGYLGFYTVPNSTGLITERGRFDSAGRLLLGLTSTKSNNAQLQVRRTDATNGALTYPLAWVQSATGFEDGFVVRATDNLVSIGADYGGTSHGVGLAFLVNNSAGAFAATEAARIDTSKNLLVGTTVGARSNGGIFFGSGGVTSARVQNWAATIANNTDTVITPNGALPASSCFLVQVSAYNTTNQNYNRTKLYLVSLRATSFSGSNITQVADSLADTGTNGEIVTLTTTISSYSVSELSLSVLAAVRSGSPNIIVSITVFGV